MLFHPKHHPIEIEGTNHLTSASIQKGDRGVHIPTTAKRFYVYALSLTDTMSQIFYIGKGQRTRLYSHSTEAERGHLCPKCSVIRYAYAAHHRFWWSILSETDDEGEALWQEMRAITSYPYGMLCNQMGGCVISVSMTSAPQRVAQCWRAVVTHFDPKLNEQKAIEIADQSQGRTYARVVEVYDRLVLNYYSRSCGYRKRQWRID